MKIKVSVATNKIGSEQIKYMGVDKEEWEEMSEEEQDECVFEFASGMINFNYEIVEK